MNDGTFRSNRNPDINISQTNLKENFNVINLFKSFKRSDQTAKLISKSKIIHDKNLLEINYGKIEGLTIDKYTQNFQN